MHTIHKLLFTHDLALIETTHPHVELAFETEREAALDELHSLFKRDVRGGCDQSVEMVRHDYERMQEEPSLAAIVENGSLKQLRIGRDLEKATALRSHCGYQIRPGFLRGELHLERINERPAAKANPLESLRSWA